MPEINEKTVHREYNIPVVDFATWRALDPFTQAYIEAAFFADLDEENSDKGFDDLAPETLKSMIADCAKFQREAVAIIRLANDSTCTAGRDFWFTRQGHGAGFWDGDWPEPAGEQLTELAESFGSLTLYTGDDGKVYT